MFFPFPSPLQISCSTCCFFNCPHACCQFSTFVVEPGSPRNAHGTSSQETWRRSGCLPSHGSNVAPPQLHHVNSVQNTSYSTSLAHLLAPVHMNGPSVGGTSRLHLAGTWIIPRPLIRTNSALSCSPFVTSYTGTQTTDLSGPIPLRRPLDRTCVHRAQRSCNAWCRPGVSHALPSSVPDLAFPLGASATRRTTTWFPDVYRTLCKCHISC